MHSPRVEWVLGIGYLAVVDLLRDRGEPDGDTLSEVIREVFAVHTPLGRARFTVALIGSGAIFHRHICKETTWPVSTT